MNRLHLYTLLLAVLLTGAAQAADVHDLYETEVTVANQQNEARQRAMRTGLAEVLVRVTGNSAAAQEPAVGELLDSAPRYVQQYRYRTVPATATEAAALMLWMSFDADAINQALRARGQPVFGRTRPLLLVWLAVENGAERRLVGATEGSTYPGLEQAARRRGIPLRLPLLDLEDQSRVTFADVWGGFHQPVFAAAARYQPQAVLIGRVHRDSRGGWQARWTLRIGDEVMNWNHGDATVAADLAAGVESSADALSKRFAQSVSAEQGGALTLRVSGVGSFADYARLLAYLGALNGVAAIQVTTVDAQGVTCQLALEAGAPAVARTISLGKTLAPVATSAAPPEGDLGAERHYRLLP